MSGKHRLHAILPAVLLLTVLSLVVDAPRAGAAWTSPPARPESPLPLLLTGQYDAYIGVHWPERQLQQAVTESMAGFSGRYSVAVTDLAGNRAWYYAPEARYHTASLVKVPVALHAFAQHRAGRMSWDSTIAYLSSDYEPSDSRLGVPQPGDELPVGLLVDAALRKSDNIAVNMLGRHFTWDAVRAFTRTISAELERGQNGEPLATVKAAAAWWQHLARIARADAEAEQALLEPLRRATYRGRISAGLPGGTPHAHKYGSFGSAYHDSGLIEVPHPYVLVVMTEGATEAEASAAIARVTAAVHRVMTAWARSVESVRLPYWGPADLPY